MSSRHRAREYVLKALYAFDQGNQAAADISRTVIEKKGLGEADLEFAQRLFDKVSSKIKSLDSYISRYAANWDISRLAVVDKNILRIAICEIEYMPDIPLKVAVNEAIELAKKYSTLESAAFVNGILDSIMKEQSENQV
jgi:N utilization substance protein B